MDHAKETTFGFDDGWSSLYVCTVPKTPPSKSNAFEEAAQQLGIPAWGEILIVALTAAGLAIGGELLHAELRLASMDTRIGGLPSAIGNQMDTKLANLRADLIKEFFQKAKQYTQAQNFGDAAAALRAATILTAIAQGDKAEAPSTFFVNAVSDLNALASAIHGPIVLLEPIHRARVALAEYRYSLTPLPSITIRGKRLTVLDSPIVAHELGYETVLRPHFQNRSAIELTPEVERMIKENFDRANTIDGFAIVDGMQQLDNFRWRHMLFVNMTIVYRGGSVEITDVTFVNCRFLVMPSEQTTRLLDFATLRQESVKLASGVFAIVRRESRAA